MKNFVITGATGHVGNNFVRLLEKEEPNANITLIHHHKITENFKNKNLTQEIGNLSDKDFLRSIITKDSIVVHVAGYIDLTNREKEKCFLINYQYTKNICDVCLEKGVKRFLYVGSVDGISRPQDPNQTITEPEDYFPDQVEGNYGQSKASAMKYVLAQMKQNPSFNACMVLPTAVIGIHDLKPSALGKILCSILSGKSELGFNGGYNFVDVEDVALAMLTLSNNNLKDHYIISGTNMTIKEMYLSANKFSGSKKQPIIFPTWLVKMCAPFTKVLNKIMLKSLTDPHNYSCEKAKKDFGYSPRPIEKTMKNTFAWLTKHYKLTLPKDKKRAIN